MNKEASFFNLPRETQYAAWLLLGFTGFIIWDQQHWWGMIEEYFFGYLAPFFVGYVIYDRWPRIARYFKLGKEEDYQKDNAQMRLPKKGDDLPVNRPWNYVKLPDATRRPLDVVFLLGLIASLIVFVFAGVYRGLVGPQLPVSQMLVVSHMGCLFGFIYFFTARDVKGELQPMGKRLSLVLWFLFPALIWLVSAPMMTFVENGISHFLLMKVTVVVFGIFDMLALPIEQRGNILIWPGGQVGVEDACSGIRSLTACLFAGSFLSAVFLHEFWKKALLVFSAMVFAFVMNIFRSLFLTVWAYNFGSDSIAGKVHDITGYAVLGFTCLGLMLLLPLFNLRLTWYEPEDPESKEALAGSS